MKNKFLNSNFLPLEILQIREQKKVKAGNGYGYWYNSGSGGVGSCEARCLNGTPLRVSPCSACAATDSNSDGMNGSVRCSSSNGFTYHYC